jgi:hypothetical protein
MIIPIITNTAIAAMLIPNALIQPVLNPLLKTCIHAIKAMPIAIVFTELPTDNTDDNILVETKNTVLYIIGPKAVTNIARRILADIHIGIETIAHRIKKEAIVMTINKIEDSFIVDN